MLHAIWLLEHEWVLVMAREGHVSLALETVGSHWEWNRGGLLLSCLDHFFDGSIKALVLHQFWDKILDLLRAKLLNVLLDDFLRRLL